MRWQYNNYKVREEEEFISRQTTNTSGIHLWAKFGGVRWVPISERRDLFLVVATAFGNTYNNNNINIKLSPVVVSQGEHREQRVGGWCIWVQLKWAIESIVHNSQQQPQLHRQVHGVVDAH